MHIVILITVPKKNEALRIAKKLIEAKLAACVNIIPKVNSVFWWGSKADNASELLLIVKSKKSYFTKLVNTVKLLHSYKVPEIIALPIVSGNKAYLDWIDESLG
ncbi:MAG: divalent-cation tolerance protein CutA [Candidatus Omnitrophota bacterium]|jgi:periplasmic divalent cation tolerance protein|nr:MAG: divalent-cation tolerance protein CutA [Candidatus Omnitrophota bacterium]